MIFCIQRAKSPVEAILLVFSWMMKFFFSPFFFKMIVTKLSFILIKSIPAQVSDISQHTMFYNIFSADYDCFLH